MSNFYARFKETKREIIAFPTQQQRDDWVNFQDEFSLITQTSAENATFKRIPLTEKQANCIIKSNELIETTHDLIGDGIILFRPTIKT